MKTKKGLFFLFILFLSVQCAWAFPIANSSNQEMSRSAAFDGTNYLVAFRETGQVKRASAQLISQIGALVGAKIITDLPDPKNPPAIAFDGANYLMIVEDDTTSSTIYGQFISTASTTVGSYITIASGGSNIEMPNILFDGANYFVVWDESGDTGGTLKGQFVSPAGEMVGSVITICAGTAPDSDVPMVYNIGFDGTNILAAWADGRNGASCGDTAICELDIYGQFISKSGTGSAGTLSGSNFAINENNDWSDMSTIGIAFDGTNYLVAWNDMTPWTNTNTNSNARLYAQLISTSGSPVGDVISIGSPTLNKHRDWPVLAFDGTNYLLTWMYTGTDANHNGVCDSTEGTCWDAFGQYISTIGTLQGAAFSIAGGAQNQMAYPVFAAGKYLIVYNSFTKMSGGTSGNISGKFLDPQPRILSPNGGENIISGSTHTVSWDAPDNAVKFKLSYSMDGGVIWTAIAPGYVTGTSYGWPVPLPTANKGNCLVKINGYDSSDVLVGSDRSDAPFALEVIKLTSPDGAEVWTSATQQDITWTTNATKNPVSKVQLLYTTNNGVTWLTIKTITGNPGTYSWTVPAVSVPKPNCMVKVLLKNSLGTAVGSEMSDNVFAIQPG
jgi:hypothetical protein